MAQEYLHPQLSVAGECSDHRIVSHSVLLLVVTETISLQRKIQYSLSHREVKTENRGRDMYSATGELIFQSSL